LTEGLEASAYVQRVLKVVEVFVLDRLEEPAEGLARPEVRAVPRQEQEQERGVSR
jgi:hypothetical protein